MAGEVTKDISQEELWEGGRSPFSMRYGKMINKGEALERITSLQCRFKILQ